MSWAHVPSTRQGPTLEENIQKSLIFAQQQTKVATNTKRKQSRKNGWGYKNMFLNLCNKCSVFSNWGMFDIKTIQIYCKKKKKLR